MELTAIALTAASVGFVHTLLGPDHYIPFVAMSKARGWSYMRTAVVTFLSGLGHVASSVLLGFAGLWAGTELGKLQRFEGLRGDFAGWLLLTFGLAYTAWGLRQAWRGKSHGHFHLHPGGGHTHAHSHAEEHAHAHDGAKANITPWILFTLLVFGPCEPLIPLVMYPAAKHSWAGVAVVTAVFGAVTVFTMLVTVMLSLFGVRLLDFSRVEKYTHALAGFAVTMCGVAVVFLGL
ncbi:MAG: sulfite exporter TauE/SafE family protein [Elusimicrobia bacterium]|nr:sulfite exporter TauE/SafE family protein [Elusimicrobiota bacterium]